MTEEYVVNITEETLELTIDGEVIVNNLPNYFPETPSGLIDGINTVFTTTYDFMPNTTKLFLNGLKLVRGIDFSETSNNTIQLSEPPSDQGFIDVLEIEYIRN